MLTLTFVTKPVGVDGRRQWALVPVYLYRGRKGSSEWVN